jgi:hypothetical protein
MPPSRRQIIKTIGGAAGLVSLAGCVSTRDLATLNREDIERNTPARRCVLDCPELQLLNDPGAYTMLRPSKHAANPVIASTSVSNVQAYPASAIQADGTFYAVAGSWPQTVGFRSKNGIKWTEVNANLVPQGDSNAFDSYKTTVHVFRYHPDEETFHVLYKGIDADGTHRYGHASSDRPLRSYVKDANNPILSARTQTEFERVSNVGRLFLSDVIVDDGTAIYFGSGTTEAGMNFVWKGTGTLWNEIRPETVLFTQEDHQLTVRSDRTPVQSPNVGAPSVIEVNGMYLMAYSSLVVINDHDFAAAQGKVYAAAGPSPDEILPTNDLLLDTGPCNSWEELRVYQPRWMKRQDGAYAQPERVDGALRLYYSGHDCGSSKFFGNRGVTGMVEFAPDDVQRFMGDAMS